MPDPVFDTLRRSDKLSLGGGRLCLWAPEFPRWADRPGFWDHAAYLEHAVEPLFAVTLLDAAGRSVALSLAGRGWTPGRLSQLYRAGAGLADPAAFPAPAPASANLRVQEDKALSPEDVFLASLQITNLLARPQRLTVVLWTAQPRGSAAERRAVDLIDAQAAPAGQPVFLFTRQLPADSVRAAHTVAFALGANHQPGSLAANNSEWSTGRANHPRWELTPFFDSARVVDGSVRLPNTVQAAGGPAGDTANSVLYLACAFPMEMAEADTARLSVGCALAPEADEAAANLARALGPLAPAQPAADAPREQPRRSWDESGVMELRAINSIDPLARGEQRWLDYFAGLPRLRCSDPYLERYYTYRYFGLRLNTVDTGGRFNLPRPAIFEGINPGWFRHLISYSAQAHMREARWLHDPALAQAALENFVRAQRADGSIPGVIHTGPGPAPAPDFMYHADWGAALRALHAVHPDGDFLRRAYPALLRYAEYLQREHDREGSHLFDVRNQAETGQEYMERYQFVDGRADQWGSLQPRLKGVDATIYAYNLFRCLEWLAEHLRQALPPGLAGAAEAVAEAVRLHLWDPASGFFYDLCWEGRARSPSRAATGFYPFLTDIPGREHLRAFDYLFDPNEFGTPCPVPSTSQADPSFSAEGEWKGRRMVCPWNGRSWLMATSHVCQAVAHTAQRLGDARLGERAAGLITRWVKCLYLDGDLERPTSYEYYNPLTGAAPFFRGTDDYMHSWIADLLVQFVAGLQPTAERGAPLVVHPLPFDLEYFALENARIRGRSVDVTWDRNAGMAVKVDGAEVARQPGRERLVIPLTWPLPG